MDGYGKLMPHSNVTSGCIDGFIRDSFDFIDKVLSCQNVDLPLKSSISQGKAPYVDHSRL